MNKIESTKVLSILKATYPVGYKDMTDNDIDALIGVWSRVFKDWNYQDVVRAIDSVIATNKTNFPPSPGFVMDRLVKNSQGQQLTEGEAWNLVYKAITRSSWYADEEFEKLPSNIKKSIGSPEMLKSWGSMNSDVVNSVIQSNFMRTFRSRSQQDIEYKALPNDVQDIIQKLTEGIGEIGDIG